MTSDFDFYTNLTPISTLSDLIAQDRMVPVPPDWSVFVADIKGSTQAVAEGHYKQVNALGAACIIAASNACNGVSFPFIFGGDGASLVIPNSYVQAVSVALSALREQAAQTLHFTLRVGCVPIGVIRANGADVLVAKQRLPGGFDLALFDGGGLTLADDLVKKHLSTYGVADTVQAPLDIDGLECRWNDVPARNGRVMTLIVKPLRPGIGDLGDLIAVLQKLMPITNPVRRENLPLDWPPQHLKTELNIKVKSRLLRSLKYVFILSVTGCYSLFIARQMKARLGALSRYVDSLAINTDHFKIDDVLRVVLDVTDAQAAEVEAILGDLARTGQVFYGVHYSSHALMTCFVRSVEHHVHFVDGGGGGYVNAATQLKSSLKAGEQVSTPPPPTHR